MSGWKEALYQSYVSSGHVTDAEPGKSTEQHFRGRRAHLQSIIRRHFPSSRASRILDIGCGHGALLYFLQKAGYQDVSGIDGSREQVELARQLGVKGVQLGDGIDFIRNREDASADVVCLFDVLEHQTREEAFDLLTEVRRVLSSGGVCIGHAPNAAGLFGMRVRYGDLTHEQAFTSASLSQLFRSVSFNNVQSYEDKPAVHGATSAVRRLIWETGTAPFRLLLMAETGTSGAILSQNLWFVAHRQ